MEDVNLRLEFHRALDAVAPPAPWLSATVCDGLRRKQLDSTRNRVGRSIATRFAVGSLLLVLLAVAVATALILSQLFAPVPVHNPPPLPGSATVPIASAPQFITPEDGLVLTGKGLLNSRRRSDLVAQSASRLEPIQRRPLPGQDAHPGLDRQSVSRDRSRHVGRRRHVAHYPNRQHSRRSREHFLPGRSRGLGALHGLSGSNAQRARGPGGALSHDRFGAH